MVGVVDCFCVGEIMEISKNIMVTNHCAQVWIVYPPNMVFMFRIGIIPLITMYIMNKCKVIFLYLCVMHSPKWI